MEKKNNESNRQKRSLPAAFSMNIAAAACSSFYSPNGKIQPETCTFTLYWLVNHFVLTESRSMILHHLVFADKKSNYKLFVPRVFNGFILLFGGKWTWNFCCLLFERRANILTKKCSDLNRKPPSALLFSLFKNWVTSFDWRCSIFGGGVSFIFVGVCPLDSLHK